MLLSLFSSLRRYARRICKSPRQRRARLEFLEARTVLDGEFGFAVTGNAPIHVGTEMGYAIVADAAGNSYSTGAFTGTVDFDPGPGVSNLTSTGLLDVFVVKLDPSGGLLWAKGFGSSGDDYGSGIAVDASGVVISGTYSGTADLDPGVGTASRSSAGGNDIFAVKLDTSGNFVYAATAGGSGLDAAYAVAVDTAGNALLTGTFAGTVDFDPGAGLQQRTSTGTQSVFVWKLTPAGNLSYVAALTGSGTGQGNGIAVNAAGEALVAGNFSGTLDFDPGAGTQNKTSAGGQDIFISTLDAAGNYVAGVTLGSTGNDVANDLALDPAGNIYTTGYFGEVVDFDPGASVQQKGSTFSSEQFFLLKLNANGTFGYVYNIGSGVPGYGLAVDSSGAASVIGSFKFTKDFDPGSGTASRTAISFLGDTFYLKVSPTGTYVNVATLPVGFPNSAFYNTPGIALDPAGNLLSTGAFSLDQDFDPGAGVQTRSSGGDLDLYVLKLDSALNFAFAYTAGWIQDNALAWTIAADNAGNSYIGGYFNGTVDFDPGPGVSNVASTWRVDSFVAKYNADGSLAWARAFNDSGESEVDDVAVDASGNVYAVGRFTGTADFDPSPAVVERTSAGGDDAFLVKLDAAGNLVYAYTLGNAQTDGATALDIDANGSVIVLGYFRGTIDFDPGPGVQERTAATGGISFVWKLDAAGNFVSALAVPGAYYNVAVDPSTNNLVLVGTFLGTVDFDPGPAAYNLTSTGSNDAFVLTLTPGGGLISVFTFGTLDVVTPKRVEVDGNGNIIVGGTFRNTGDFDPGSGVTNLTSAGEDDGFVAKYDSSGALVFAARFGGTGFDQLNGVGVDVFGNVYSGGSFPQNTIDFDPGSGVVAPPVFGFMNAFVSRLDPQGNFSYAATIPGNSIVVGTAMAVDRRGNVFTTGYFEGEADFDPDAGVALRDGGNEVFFVSKLLGKPDALIVTLDGAGNLRIEDGGVVASEQANDIAVKRVGNDLVITDANQAFLQAPAGGVLSNNGYTLTIPWSAVTGALTFETRGGNDKLTIDLSGGDAIPAGGIVFNGGAPTSAPGDSLAIVGGNQGTVTYNYLNASDGNIVLSNYGMVTYTGLEPISNSGSATDVIFNLPATINAATLADDGIAGNGLSRLSGGTFETTDFANPTGTLTINRGNVSDTLTLGNLPDFTAGLSIGSTSARFNWVTFDGPVNLGANKNLTGFANQGIAFSTANSDVATAGSGAVSLTAGRDVYFAGGSSLTTVDGALALTANMDGGLTGGSFIGIALNDAVVQSTGLGSLNLQGWGGRFDSGSLAGISVNGANARISTANGDITLYGRGGGTASVESNYGIMVFGGGTISAGGAGNLNALAEGGNVTGTGHDNIGIRLRDAGSKIITQAGNLTLDGRGGGSSAAANHGISLDPGTRIAAGGMGTTSVSGRGGGYTTGGGNANIGVILWGGEITSGGGPVIVAGIGGGAAGSNNNYGVFVHVSGVITAGGIGSVQVTGTGGNNVGPSFGNYGVRMDVGGTITSSGGNVSVTGIAGGSASSSANAGLMMTGGVITSGGSGTLTIQGNQGTGTGSLAQGIVLTGTASIVVGQGDASITALATNTAVPALDMLGSAAISTTGAGNLLVTADRINLAESSTISSAANALTIMPTTNGFGIDLGGVDNATTLGLTDAELDRITAGTLKFGQLAIAPIVVSGAISRPAATNVILSPSANVTFSTGSINTAGGTLTTSLSGSNLKPQSSGVDITAPLINFADTTWLEIAINGAIVNTQYSQLNLAGSIDLTGARLNLIGTYTPTSTNSFTIINNDGSDAIVGTFIGLPEGAFVSINAVNNKRITYRGGTGNDVVLRPLNSVPTITSNGSGTSALVSMPSGDTLVTTVTATDADTAPVDTLTYSIIGGADQAKFTIDPATGVLRFSTVPVWYNPTDAGANNTYDVTVRGSDGNGGTDTQSLAVFVNNLVPYTTHKDLIYDHVRRQLLITTDTQLLRFDEVTGTMLPPITVGTSLNGADITPDGNYLYVSSGSGLRKVNLNTLAVTTVQSPTALPDRYTRDIAFLANGTAKVGGPFGANGSTGVLTLNPLTDTYDTGSLVTSNVSDLMYRSADRSQLLFMKTTISGGFASYSLVGGHQAAASTQESMDTDLAGVSRDGNLSAMEFDDTVVIFDRNNRAVQELPDSDAGFIFHPTQDLIIVANGSNNRLYGYDTNTWELRWFLATSENVLNSLPYDDGVMAISPDGQFLYQATPSGVRQYRLPANTGVASQIDLTNYGTYLSTAHQHSITVTMRDPSGAVATGYTGTVRFNSNNVGAILPANYTFTAADAGTHTFTFRLPTASTSTQVNVQDVSNASLTKTTTTLTTHSGATVIPVTGARDIVFDHVRNMAYIITTSGTILRYDVATESLVAPWNFSKHLAGADITADGNYMYVQEGLRNASTGMVRKIDLNTGTMTRLTYDLAWNEGGGWELAIDANGIAFMVADFQGSGDVPLRRLSTATDTFTQQAGLHATVRGPSHIFRNSSRTQLGFIEPGISNGPIFTYSATTNTFPNYLETNNFFNIAMAINTVGTVVATSRSNTGAAVEIRNSATLAVVQTLATNGGLAFKPGTNLLYVAASNQASVYDGNNSWNRSTFLTKNLGDNVGTPTPLGAGNLTFSPDGRRLFVVTQTGVSVVSTADGTPPNASGLPGTQTILEDASTAALTFSVSDNQTTASLLTVSATSSNPTLIPNANIVFGGAGSSRNLTVTPAAHLNGGPVTITVTVTDSEGNLRQFSFDVLVNPVNDAPGFMTGANPVVPMNAPAQSVSGWATSISSGPANENGQAVSFQVMSNSNAALFTAQPAVAADGTLTFTPATGAIGLATITLVAKDNGETASGGIDTSATQSFTITINPPPTFQVTTLVPTSTGFVVNFSRNLDAAVLNLYDTQGSGIGPADIVLQGATVGNIRGSMVVDPSLQRLTFIATTGTLPADQYIVTLRSAVDGVRDSGFELLDGDANGVAGGNYVTMFTVATPPANLVAVQLANFARGPQQPVNLPATASTGAPLSFSDGGGITSALIQLRYDPTLLTISAATIAPGLPVDAMVTLNTTTPGIAAIQFTSTTPLAAGTTRFVDLQMSVPSSAPYRTKHILDFTNIVLNGGSIPASDDDAVHVVAYFGDVTANGTYSAQDASQVARLAVGLDGGLVTFKMLDPTIIADITGNGSFSATDTSRMLQAAVGIQTPEIPPLPQPAVTLLAGGPDPKLSIPRNLTAIAGQSLSIPIEIDSIVDLTGNGLTSADLVLYYDPKVIDVHRASLGTLLTSMGGWMISSRIDPLAGRIDISIASSSPLEGTFLGELVQLQATVRENAPTGGSAINLAATSRTRSTQLNEGFLTLIPAPTDAANDPIDGLLTITPTSTTATGATAQLIDNRLLVIGTNSDDVLLIKPTADGSQQIVRANHRILGTFTMPASIAVDGLSGGDYVYVDPTAPASLIATAAEDESPTGPEDLIFAGDSANLIDSPSATTISPTGQHQSLSPRDAALLHLLDQWTTGNDEGSMSGGPLRRRR